MTISTADCVQEIVKVCANPKAVVAAYCGGMPEDYEDEELLKEAMEQMWVDEGEGVQTTQDFLNLLTKLCTNPKNWKRMTKEKLYNGDILRCFDCRPFDDQLRAYVTERNGEIVEVGVQGE